MSPTTSLSTKRNIESDSDPYSGSDVHNMTAFSINDRKLIVAVLASLQILSKKQFERLTCKLMIAVVFEF